MNKRDKIKSDYARVKARLGKTTGASKGRTVKTKVKVKPTISKKRVGAKITMTF